ncbi:MAG: PKD domain-containing protein, partial [Chloroflexi bacterium]|nr:PKD domain-containing protein [Chloroflexota bacterium]
MELTLLSLLLSSAVEPVLTSLENKKSYRLPLCRPQVFTKFFCAFIVAGLALALASCGGGGSGDDKNHSPVAKAGADVSVTLPYAQTSVKVQLDGSESYDIDGDSLTYSWTGSKDPDDVEQPELQLTAGNYLFHLAVTDSQGVSSALDSVEVSVIDASTLKALEADPSSLTFSALQQSTQLKVTATYNNDSVWDVTTLASGTQYLPENPGIISIDKDGLARAIGIGQTSIRIQNGALSLYVMAKVDTPPVAPVAASKTAIETLESQISDSLVVSWNPNSGLPVSMITHMEPFHVHHNGATL